MMVTPRRVNAKTDRGYSRWNIQYLRRFTFSTLPSFALGLHHMPFCMDRRFHSTIARSIKAMASPWAYQQINASCRTWTSDRRLLTLGDSAKTISSAGLVACRLQLCCGMRKQYIDLLGRVNKCNHKLKKSIDSHTPTHAIDVHRCSWEALDIILERLEIWRAHNTVHDIDRWSLYLCDHDTHLVADNRRWPRPLRCV